MAAASETDTASSPWPSELRLAKDRKALTIVFDTGETLVLDAEYLRVAIQRWYGVRLGNRRFPGR